MNITKSQVAIIAIIVLSFAVSIYFYPQLPDRMASHWNARGEVDGYMDKDVGAFLMPCIITGIFLLFMLIIRIDPLKANIEKFKNYYYGFIIMESLFLFGIHCWMMLWNVGYKSSPNIIMPAGLGPFLVFLGYILKNVKRNWFIGIRTPWTLSNELVWKRTHEIGGTLFMISGVIAMAGILFREHAIWFILVPVIASSVFLIVYSYILFRKVTAAQLDGTAEEMKIESSGDTTWDNIKEGYLYQVERSLLKVKHPAKKQVLEDVSAHLDMKYAEPSEEKRDWENYQGIITDMGPAEDYAELLDGESMQPGKQASSRFVKCLKVFALISIFFGLACWWFGLLPFGRLQDNIDVPFLNDPEVIGVWESVDFVENIGDFAPDQKRWFSELFLHNLTFKEDGWLVAKNDNAKNGYSLKWTKGIIISSRNKTASKYHIEEIDGEKYMFYEWKSGDYTIRHQKPSYYILKKVPVGTDIAVVELKVHPCYDEELRAKGFYNVTASIRNNGKDRCGEFGVYFYKGDPATNKPRTHSAGPIKSGETWNEYTGPFELKEGVNEFFVIADPDNSVRESDETNNRTWIKVVVSQGQIKDETTGFGKARVSRPSIEESTSSAYTWLELIDHGRYGESWQEAASIFKAHVSQAQWEKALESIYTPLGIVINREAISQTPAKTLPGAPDGDYVVIQFRTEFENKKEAIETVTPMLEKDGRWRISGYFIK